MKATLKVPTWFGDCRLDAAYKWLCQRRRGYPADADIWWLRQQWSQERPKLVRELTRGCYRFAPLKQITLKTGESIELWSARDALVLKLLSWALADILPASPSCTHLKNHGGAKFAVRKVREHLPENQFVMRTDAKSYYASIDHYLLLEQLSGFVKDRFVLNLLAQYLRRSVEYGGLYRDINCGISLGCPLSPIMSAFFLYKLDLLMEKSEVFYLRFMDDVLVLAATRWKLRKAVRSVNQVFAGLGLAKHPDKTFIGRIEKGFDFLGYHFDRNGLRLAQATLDRFIIRATRLYEQEQGGPDGFPLLGLYLRRWRTWAAAGVA